MCAAVRSYSGPGASELFDALAQKQEDVKSVIGGAPGFVSYGPCELRTAAPL